MNFIIRTLCHFTITCSCVGPFLTTYRSGMATFGNYEIHSVNY